MDAEAIVVMLREDRAQWEALTAVLDSHPERSLHDPSSPPWTSRDVYAHLARWIERSTSELGVRLEGGTLQQLAGTDDEINARWQQEDSELSLDEARERAQQAFERRLRAIEGVPTDRWDEVLGTIARADGAEHYAGHRSYVSVT